MYTVINTPKLQHMPMKSRIFGGGVESPPQLSLNHCISF